MKCGRGTAQWKTRLLFPGTTLVIGVAAFAVGYRTPKSVPTGAAKGKQQPGGGAHVSLDHRPVVHTFSSGPLQRDDLHVEGFAKIGFPELEELLTRASAEQREQWARELGNLPQQPLKVIAMVAFYSAWLDLDPNGAIRSLRDSPDRPISTPLGLSTIPASGLWLAPCD